MRAVRLTVVAVALLLAGCGSPETPSPSSPDVTTSGGASSSASTEPAPETSTAPDVDLDVAPASRLQAQDYVEAAREQGAVELKLETFRTSDDIFCKLVWDDLGGPFCEYPEGGGVLDPVQCPADQGDTVTRIEITSAGAQPSCTPGTIRQGDAETVLPLQIVYSDEMECVVAAVGVTCLEYYYGGGYVMSADRYLVLNEGG